MATTVATKPANPPTKDMLGKRILFRKIVMRHGDMPHYGDVCENTVKQFSPSGDYVLFCSECVFANNHGWHFINDIKILEVLD